ncbi:MAG: hypothetical protein ACK57J_04185 [Rubrivivax sp.]|jgi:hypothetical protein
MRWWALSHSASSSIIWDNFGDFERDTFTNKDVQFLACPPDAL